MFLHAVTGCDTVSAIYRQGKPKAFNMVHSTQQDFAFLDTFPNNRSTHSEVKTAGETFILKLYRAKNCEYCAIIVQYCVNCASLDEYRHIAYKRVIGRSSLSSTY